MKSRQGATRELDIKNCNKKNKSAKKNIKYPTGINHKSSQYGFRLRKGNVESINEKRANLNNPSYQRQQRPRVRSTKCSPYGFRFLESNVGDVIVDRELKVKIEAKQVDFVCVQ